MSKIIHGDSFKLLGTLADQSVEAIITDPPFGLTNSQIQTLHTEFCRIAKGTIIVFAPPENQWLASQADQICFWNKPISTKNTTKSYSRFVEMIFIFTTYNEIEGKWNINRHWSQYQNIFTDSIEANKAIKHPHIKPSSLIQRLIENHTDVGDTVLDPFCGSGTIPLVSRSLRRRYLGVELDPEYFALTCKRLQQTRKKS